MIQFSKRPRSRRPLHLAPCPSSSPLPSPRKETPASLLLYLLLRLLLFDRSGKMSFTDTSSDSKRGWNKGIGRMRRGTDSLTSCCDFTSLLLLRLSCHRGLTNPVISSHRFPSLPQPVVCTSPAAHRTTIFHHDRVCRPHARCSFLPLRYDRSTPLLVLPQPRLRPPGLRTAQ
jgi:hypothetical protein